LFYASFSVRAKEAAFYDLDGEGAENRIKDEA
jgi:hypothetical protein